jgi:ribonuclease PH
MARTERSEQELRPLSLEPGASPHAEGSCLIATGNTRVLCTASVLDEVPGWREGSGAGWVTGEYGMLPRSTHTRRGRERDGPGGRTMEIQRLIGRALRSVVELEALGPRTVVVDCDVLQADGGTRTAAVTGGCVALALAFGSLREEGLLDRTPLLGLVGAVSVGLVDGRVLLDLDYREDSRARVDMNVVGTEDGRLVEVQGTAEGDPFSREALDRLTDLAQAGIRTLISAQREVLGGFPGALPEGPPPEAPG